VTKSVQCCIHASVGSNRWVTSVAAGIRVDTSQPLQWSLEAHSALSDRSHLLFGNSSISRNGSPLRYHRSGLAASAIPLVNMMGLFCSEGMIYGKHGCSKFTSFHCWAATISNAIRAALLAAPHVHVTYFRRPWHGTLRFVGGKRTQHNTGKGSLDSPLVEQDAFPLKTSSMAKSSIPVVAIT